MRYNEADDHARYTDDAEPMRGAANLDERMRGYRNVGNVPEQWKEEKT